VRTRHENETKVKVVETKSKPEPQVGACGSETGISAADRIKVTGLPHCLRKAASPFVASKQQGEFIGCQ
jgi:hypothetical protein